MFRHQPQNRALEMDLKGSEQSHEGNTVHQHVVIASSAHHLGGWAAALSVKSALKVAGSVTGAIDMEGVWPVDGDASNDSQGVHQACYDLLDRAVLKNEQGSKDEAAQLSC